MSPSSQAKNHRSRIRRLAEFLAQALPYEDWEQSTSLDLDKITISTPNSEPECRTPEDDAAFLIDNGTLRFVSAKHWALMADEVSTIL
jgi:hypothetical protein